MVIDFYNNHSTASNYILDINSTETNLNISTYLNGLYTVALIVNGVIVDAKTLIKH